MEAITNAVLELAEKHIKDYRVRNGQLMAKRCPFCGGGSHDDYETFAIGLNNGLWNCMRGSCNKKSGNFKELCEYFGELKFTSEDFGRLTKNAAPKKKSYDKPNPDDLKELTEEIITYFARRRISEQTLKDWRIASDSNGNIVFPFYRNGVLTFIKRRKPIMKHTKEDGPKEWQDPNTEPILFGMDNVSFNKPLVICEGEIDALSLYEAGVTNVVSVPSGCKNMEWITICYDWLKVFNQIILFGDSDEPGTEMVSVVSKRLGEERCMTPAEYPQLIYGDKDYGRCCKDANEILYAWGPEALKQMVDSCEAAPVKGVLNLASVRHVDPDKRPKIITRIPALDYNIGGLMLGGLTVFSGKRGCGKSTVAGTLALNAIEEGYSVCAYSGELPADMYLEWILLQATESKYIGYKTDPKTGKNMCVISHEIEERIRDWIDGKFYLYDNSCITDDKQDESILKVFEACARRYGCKLFIFDNLMAALTSSEEEYKAQAKLMARLKSFASQYNVHVIIVAHPRKTKADAEFSNDDISGSAVITNLADSVINVERPNLNLTKNRSYGTQDYILCTYDPCNRRIFQTSVGDRTVYSWNHEGIALPENPANTLPEFQLQTREKNKPPF